MNIEEFYISADFVYDRDEGAVLIFCDGSVHDEVRVKRQDGHKRKLLEQAGYDVNKVLKFVGSKPPEFFDDVE